MIQMWEGILVSLVASLLAYALSGARSTAYLMYYVSFVPFLTLDAAQGGMTGLDQVAADNVLFKLGFRVLASAGFGLLLWRRRSELGWILRPQHMPVLGFFLWALLSIDRAHSPWVSLVRLGELLIFFLAGVALFLESARFHRPREVARWHALALLQILIVAVYFMYRRPELAYHVGADGLLRLGHKLLNANSLGFAGVIILLWAIHDLVERTANAHAVRTWIVPLAAIALAVFVLVLARSRTAMLAAIVGQFVLWLPLRAKSSRRGVVFLLFTLALIAIGLASSGSIEAWFLRGESSESLRTGTGRTALWAALLDEQVRTAPLLGQGYLSLSDQGTFAHAGRDWNNAHNTYLFALVSNGIPGLLAILLAMCLPWLAILKRALRAAPEERAAWRLLLALETVVALFGVTEFGICGYPNPVMLFHYALFAYALAPPLLPVAPAAQRETPGRFVLLAGGSQS